MGASGNQKTKLREWLSAIPGVRLFFSKPVCVRADTHLQDLLVRFRPDLLVVFWNDADSFRSGILATIAKFRGEAKVFVFFIGKAPEKLSFPPDLIQEANRISKTPLQDAVRTMNAASRKQRRPE